MNLFKVNYEFLDNDDNQVGSDCIFAFVESESEALENTLTMASQFGFKPFYKSVETLPVGSMFMSVGMQAVPAQAESLITLVGDGGKAVN